MDDINLIVALIGLFISIAGMIVSIFIVRKPRPLYALRLSKLDGVKHPNISIHFEDRKIINLYSIRLVFWNGGKKEIRKEDIPEPKAGPNIKVSDNSEILTYTTETTTGDKSSRFIPSGNDLSIDFDYLNKGDAFLGEIFLTTVNKNPPEITFKGALKGAKIQKGDVYNISVFDHFFFTLIGGVFLFFTLMAGYAIFLASASDNGQILVVIIIFLVLLTLTIVDFRFNILSIPNKIPKKYLEFLETGEICT